MNEPRPTSIALHSIIMAALVSLCLLSVCYDDVKEPVVAYGAAVLVIAACVCMINWIITRD